MRRTGRLDGSQADETADTVFGMDDDRAFIQTRDFRDEICGALAATRAAHHAVAENILFADDDEIAGLKAGFEAEHGRSRLTLRKAGDILQRRNRLDAFEAVFVQHLQQALERTLGP